MELWHVPLRIGPELAQRAAGLLDPGESARAARFRLPEHRQAFIAAHAALRHLVARAAGLEAQALAFEPGAAGKPALAAHQACGIEFNLSHSGPQGVVAISRGEPVGVDIEMLDRLGRNPAGLDELAGVFSPDELRAIDGCEPPERPLARLRCWVRKEAVLKAAGCGFDDQVRAVTVSVGAQARLLASRHPALAAGEWSLAAFEAPGRWTGALCVRGPMPRVAVREWSWTG